MSFELWALQVMDLETLTALHTRLGHAFQRFGNGLVFDWICKHHIFVSQRSTGSIISDALLLTSFGFVIVELYVMYVQYLYMNDTSTMEKPHIPS